jgi:hypothetical protein
MDIEFAEKTVRDIGNAYFFDERFENTIEGCVTMIITFIDTVWKLEGLTHTKIECQAIFMILEQYDDNKLDEIISKTYGFIPERAGGGRTFFTDMAQRMAKQIKITKTRLVNKENEK